MVGVGHCRAFLDRSLSPSPNCLKRCGKSIPSSTYARYERADEGPECGIPLPAAWQIADALGCTIDLVVGRADIDQRDAGTLDARAGALNPANRAMLEGFLGYLESLEAPSRRQVL